MGCGCGKGKTPNLPVAKKTSGAWKLNVDGQTLYFDTRVGAQSSNVRNYGGRGTVERA